MKATVKRVKGLIQPDIVEDEAYWNHHTDQQKASGLSRREYCHLNNVNYNRFDYQIRKDKEMPTSLLAVKIKPSEGSLKQVISLGTLNFSNGSYLQIHDTQALSIILKEMI
jgi:hypothetical protein